MKTRITVAFKTEKFENTGEKEISFATLETTEGIKYDRKSSSFASDGRAGKKNESGAKKFLKLLKKGEHELFTNFVNAYKTNKEAIEALETYLAK
jgi:hypothetical protein